MIKRKNPLCSGKKGKVFSFQLEAAVIVMTIAQPLRVVSQDALDHMRKTPGRREVRRWYGVPQKSLPGLPLTDPAPHTRDEGGTFGGQFLPLVVQAWVSREMEWGRG